MTWWQETLLKAFTCVAAMLALAGAVLLFLIRIVANGSAISDLDFSWAFFAGTAAVAAAQIWLVIAGSRSALRSIDRWSLELTENRTISG